MGHYWQKGEVTNPNGRPSTFTEDLGNEIVRLIWEGECRSITAVARLDGMPTRMTIFNWTKTYPEFGARLFEARCALGDVYDDEIEVIKNRMLSGALDPNSANVAIKSNQWKAMAVNPVAYSPKSYVDKNETKTVTHVFSDRISIEDLSEEELDALEGALTKSKLMLTGPTKN